MVETRPLTEKSGNIDCVNLPPLKDMSLEI